MFWNLVKVSQWPLKGKEEVILILMIIWSMSLRKQRLIMLRFPTGSEQVVFRSMLIMICRSHWSGMPYRPLSLSLIRSLIMEIMIRPLSPSMNLKKRKQIRQGTISLISMMRILKILPIFHTCALSGQGTELMISINSRSLRRCSIPRVVKWWLLRQTIVRSLIVLFLS